MEKKKVLVTGVIPEQGLQNLQEKCDVTYSDGEPYSRKWILDNISEYEGLLLMGTKGDKELIDAASKLKVIAVNAVGFDHVDIEYAKEKGIVVANAPQGVRVPTAEMTIALLLATVRRLHEYDSIVRSGDWVDVSEQKYMGMSLQGKTLGIFGMGRIGSTVGKFAQALGMKVIYNDAHRLTEDLEKELDVKYVKFEELVENSDVITLHAPALLTTVGVFNSNVFSKMKNTAYIVNAARGALINQSDLVEALENHDIAGAGLDVFETEPDIPESLRKLENVIMSPHAGTGTLEARIDIAAEASNNIISVLENGKATNMVNNVDKYM
ncbi:glyoxylate reductase, NADH-dependent [Paucilactobacillus oligofermentans DSM 15707 = LMG 22743]|uniref:Glyoxylate reductase, NADH-dependent n=1 Tax=Paucilactobacillus oligofermentans DSM 15707 = LMG 22743 TaxID=1423778 RepID=A0A0R1RGT6_9LACO|nr:NAD(P)-dependent oxidoreductase [Paucilactobacillus oligofermentans]KRL55593.1 glyoxylate reductase, NADH-dependent [Paucilactobacillus oligofermentans DSM 15707 = LMG 22743]CUS25418.1 Glyoxylate reductase [Paucilactobacillus oligofermentans DSM 15707 = LMG 22743]